MFGFPIWSVYRIKVQKWEHGDGEDECKVHALLSFWIFAVSGNTALITLPLSSIYRSKEACKTILKTIKQTLEDQNLKVRYWNYIYGERLIYPRRLIQRSITNTFINKRRSFLILDDQIPWIWWCKFPVMIMKSLLLR